MARSKLANLKGIKLYNALVRELGVINAKESKKQRLSPKERREIVSKVLYPKFKGGYKVAAVKTQIQGIVKKLPPAEICNPLYLSEAYLSFVEYFEIDNHIKRVLPECLDIRVNAGQFGITKIFNTSNYSYYGNGVQKIIENIREKLKNESGRAYFNGIVKVKPKRPDNGKGENYFVDYVLYINDLAEDDDIGTSYRLPKREDKKVDKVQEFIAGKVKTLQKEKAKRKRQAKRAAQKLKEQDPEEVKKRANKAINDAIASLRLLLKNKVITKAEFERQKADLKARLKP